MFNNLLEQESEERSRRTNYVQRDLEDQISEEYRALGIVYQRSDTNNSDNMSSSTTPEIVVQDVLDLLKKGYTRLAKDNKGYGSIQAHYSLTPGQVVQLFKHPKLKAKKTMSPTQLNIVDRDAPIIPTEADLLTGDFIERAAVMVGGEVIPVQDVVVTSTDVPQLAASTTSREQLFS